MNDDLQNKLGTAAIILAVLLGLSACAVGNGYYVHLSGGRSPVQLEFRK
jgi:hypothetical protein